MFIRTVNNSDTTDEVLPVDIYPEINVSYEKVNPNASPAVFFDTYGHAVVPFQGGLAIRNINADETQTEGIFHRQSMMAEDM